MMGYALLAWAGVAAWLLLFAVAVHYARRTPPPMESRPILAVFLEEDQYERTVRETGINPAAPDTRLPDLVWPLR
jgi:hypothetical protein